VYPALGLYVPFPETAAVPTAVPPLAHVVGALACGPNTVNVIVPPAPLVAPERAELIEPGPIAVPVASLAGAPTLVTVLALATAVEVIPLPHALADPLLLASPL
jgi:hypothetical protein